MFFCCSCFLKKTFYFYIDYWLIRTDQSLLLGELQLVYCLCKRFTEGCVCGRGGWRDVGGGCFSVPQNSKPKQVQLLSLQLAKCSEMSCALHYQMHNTDLCCLHLPANGNLSMSTILQTLQSLLRTNFLPRFHINKNICLECSSLRTCLKGRNRGIKLSAFIQQRLLLEGNQPLISSSGPADRKEVKDFFF